MQNHFTILTTVSLCSNGCMDSLSWKAKLNNWLTISKTVQSNIEHLACSSPACWMQWTMSFADKLDYFSENQLNHGNGQREDNKCNHQGKIE